MILPMARPHKNPKTGIYYFRQKTPADLREVYGKAEAARSLRTKDPEIARARHVDEVVKQTRIWQSLRAAPTTLPHKQIMALVDMYRGRLDAMLEDEPGEAEVWANVLRLETACGSEPEALETWGGSAADTLLRDAGLAADAYSRSRLLGEMHKARIDWATFQHRRATGDYSPDPSTQRFPEWTPEVATAGEPTSPSSEGITLTALFELWKIRHLNDKKAPRTVVAYSGVSAHPFRQHAPTRSGVFAHQ